MDTLPIFLYYFLLFLTLYTITKLALHKINNLPPTPFPCLPIIGHLHLLKRPIHRTLAKLANRHGPVLYLRFGSRHVIVASSPSAAEECLSKNDVVFANRPTLTVGKYLGYNSTVLTLTPYGDHWRNLRRIVSLQLLSTHQLLNSADIRSNEVRALVHRLFRDGPRTVDMRTAFFELTFNAIMMMIAGRRFYGESVTNEEEAKRFRENQEETFRLSAVTHIQDFLPWARPKRKLIERLERCGRNSDEFAQYLLEEELRNMESDHPCSSSTGEKNMIRFLLSMREKEPEYYSDDIIKGIMIVLLETGTDTTINTMEWAMSLLVNHPEALKKAQIEMDTVIGNDRFVQEADLAQLPYLRAIVSETMRMYPVAPLLLPHEASQDCTVGGYRVLRGAMLFVNLWAIQNDPAQWDDPERFVPERLVGLRGPREGFKLLPFGSGRRSCPGEGLALLLVGLTLGSLIQCFEWDRVGDEVVDMAPGAGVTMPKLEPLHLICRPRPNMVKLLSQVV